MILQQRFVSSVKIRLSQKRNRFLIIVSLVALTDLGLQWFLRDRVGVANFRMDYWWAIAIWLLVWWIGRSEKKLWWYCLLLGGGVNTLTRFWFGFVWDYLYLPIFPFWFNGADILINLGVGMLIYEHGVKYFMGRRNGASS